MTDLEQTLARRTDAARALLSAALRIELAAFLSKALEERLRARPHFLARTPQIALAQMRAEIEQAAVELGERAERPVDDLRAFLGAEVRSEADEAQALTRALDFAVDKVKELLTVWCFPGDNRPDRAEDSGVDLDAQHRVALVLSPNLVWAFRKVRALDTLRNTLADGQPLGEGLEVKLYLPEALPLDKTDENAR